MANAWAPTATSSRPNRSTLLLPLLLLLLATGAFAQSGQFADPGTPAYAFDRIEGEVVNLETQLIKPILFAEDESRLIVCNDADNRVMFFDPDLNLLGETVVGQGIAAVALNGSEVWVSVRHQSMIAIIDMFSFQILDVLRPDIPDFPATPGAGPASTLGGIAIHGGKAYVASSDHDSLLVFDTTTRLQDPTIVLEADHNGSSVSMNDPYNVDVYEGKIYVTSNLSGNQTTARIAGGLDIDDPGVTNEDLGPDQVTVVDLGDVPGFSLPDFDVACYDPAQGTVSMGTGVGTVLMGMAPDFKKDRLIVSNLESRNADFVGETSFPDGQVAFNRITFVDPVTLQVQDTRITESLIPGDKHVVMPTDIAVLPTGRFFVAGYSSSNIGVWDKDLNFQGEISTDAGPRGLAVARLLARLYCLNRAAGTVQMFDLTGAPAVPTFMDSVTLPDPTFDRVKQGRIVFLDPQFSGAGTTNCASCHVDGRRDGLGWNLSKLLTDDPDNLPPNFDPQDPPFRDHKGVMTTQSLQGIEANAPYHWRGEQKDMQDFKGAFSELLRAAEEPTDEEFALLEEYVFSLRYPPNPLQQMNRGFTADALTGLGMYGMGNQDCNRCHGLPLGTDADIQGVILGDAVNPKVVKPANLRGLWLRLVSLADINPAPGTDPLDIEWVSSTGFGLVHEGVCDDLPQFFEHFMEAAIPVADRPFITEFLNQYDTGLAPSTMYSAFLDSTSTQADFDRVEQYMIPQANNFTYPNMDVAPHSDLCAKGQIRGVNVGLYYDRDSGNFLVDTGTPSSPKQLSFQTLKSQIQSGNGSLLFLGVPVGSGQRIGVDRDRDGYFDAAELADGLNPTDPDTDGDGYWDGYDPNPLVPEFTAPAGVPEAYDIQVVLVNTNNIKVRYRTTQPSPTIVQFGELSEDEWTIGDATPSTAPEDVGNHWKTWHEAVIGPDPRNGLLNLKPSTEYKWRIVTLGQNGSTDVEDPTPITTEHNLNPINTTFRADEILVTKNVEISPGIFDYEVEVHFITNQGDPMVMEGKTLPGRFTMYRANGDFSVEHVSGTIQNGVATLAYRTQAGQQSQGERVTLDLSMWLSLLGVPTVFPGGGGQWPDGPSIVEFCAGIPCP